MLISSVVLLTHHRLQKKRMIPQICLSQPNMNLKRKEGMIIYRETEKLHTESCVR